MSRANWKRLLFIHNRGYDFGVFVFPKYYCMALVLFTAKRQSKTWIEFWDCLDSECREFLEPFMQCDETPRTESRIDDLDMFIFNDVEFPMTQFAEETYTEIKAYLPLDLMEIELRTEYHHYIGVFPVKHFDSLKKHLDESGFKVDKVTSMVPLWLYNY